MLSLLAGLVLAGFLTGCLEVEPRYSVITVSLQAPGEQPGLDMTLIKVRAQGVEEPVFYQTYADASGNASLKVSPGRYTLLVSAIYTEGFSVSASHPEFLALPSETSSFSLKLDMALSGGIIFRQVYYAGSRTLEGANYTKDQFLELYNNTDQVYYLDSLCIGALAPANSTVSNNPWMGRDTVGLFQMTWMIPGSGTDYPLGPGESVVLAFNAVDHTSRSFPGLDLSKAHFGFYDEALPNHEKHPDVPALRRIFAGQGTAYTMSVHSPAPVIFRPVMGVTRWLEDAATWQNYQPGSSSGLKYLHIHRSWILDGVECVQNPASALKRQPTSVDAGYTWLQQGPNRGTSVIRKISETLPGGRVIYSDTNNSAEDFLGDVPAAPVLKPLWK
ncbi:MAG: DUF4876 domain-containing protein [Bacteroidales bacterium]|jgi:hypothetical protein|nr:DUF4876 domain-containing protein [Bacteroidales bacterium]